MQFVVPIIVGASVALFGLRLTSIGELLAGFSVLAGFLFGLVIFVFQLRLGLPPEGAERQRPAELPHLIDELFANVLYAVTAAFVLIGITIAAIAVAPRVKSLVGGGEGLDPLTSAIIVTVALHLLAVVWMCIRRTRTAYAETKSL